MILTTLPAFKSYRENLNKAQLTVTINTVTQFVKNNDDCYYINFLEDQRFKASDYYDADHLSEIGAEKLSHIIADTISYLNEDDQRLAKKDNTKAY